MEGRGEVKSEGVGDGEEGEEVERWRGIGEQA